MFNRCGVVYVLCTVINLFIEQMLSACCQSLVTCCSTLCSSLPTPCTHSLNILTRMPPLEHFSTQITYNLTSSEHYFPPCVCSSSQWYDYGVQWQIERNSQINLCASRRHHKSDLDGNRTCEVFVTSILLLISDPITTSNAPSYFLGEISPVTYIHGRGKGGAGAAVSHTIWITILTLI